MSLFRSIAASNRASALVCCALFAFPRLAAAFPDGPPWDVAGQNGQGCVQCHFDAPAVKSAAALAIEGLPSKIVPGRHYRLTLMLKDDAMRAAGFLLSAWQNGNPSGSFTATDERTTVRAAQARSTAAGSQIASPGVTKWTVIWIAPRRVAAPVVIELWANAANDDLSPLGDTIYVRRWRLRGVAPVAGNETR